MQPGLKDYVEGLQKWRLCLYLGWEDVRQRYARTFLGPLWLTISHAIWIATMSFVMSSLLGSNLMESLPYITAGTLVWTFIASIMTESGSMFVQSTSIITTIYLPISVHIYRFIIRNFIIFLHNLLILCAVLLLCRVKLTFYHFLAIPSLCILLLNALWIGSILGMLSTRFRDIQQIIVTSMTILPFVTPIFWDRGVLKKHFWIANINPFYHAVEIVRAPLLGQMPNPVSLPLMTLLTLVGLTLTIKVFNLYKHRIIYWL